MNKIEKFIKMLENSWFPWRRKRAAEELGKTRDIRAIYSLIKAMNDKNIGVRVVAERSLVSIGKPAIPDLVKILKGNNFYSNQSVAEVLDSIGWKPSNNSEKKIFYGALKKWDQLPEVGREAVEILINALDDWDEYSRGDAAAALGKVGDPRAREPLIKLLKDEASIVRKKSSNALVKIGWKPSNKNEKALFFIAAQEWDQLTALGKDAAAPLIDILNDRDTNVRKEAAVVLGKIGGSKAVEPLINLLKDEDSSVQDKAADALVKIGIPSVNPLIGALTNRDTLVRKKAAGALSRIGDPRAVEPFINILKSKDSIVHDKAAKALVRIGKPSVVPLINTLKDAYSMVKEKAAEILVRIGESAIEPLFKELKANDCNLRKRVAEVLDKTPWEPLNKSEKALYLIAKQEWHQLPPLNRDAVEPLINVLEDENSNVRKNAVETLGKIRNDRAVEPIIGKLKDENLDVQNQAVIALGKIGDSKAVGPLSDALRHGKYGKINVVSALVEIGDVRAIKPLVSFYAERLKYWNKWYLNKKDAEKEAKEMLEKICAKIPVEDHNFFCHECCCRTERHKSKLSYFKTIKYYACRKCHSNSYLIEGIEKVVLLLDHNFKENYVQNGGTLTINWFKKKEPFDFDEIWIKKVDEFEIEELVMILRNDMDDKRRKRLPGILLLISPTLKFSQAKTNLLKDNFRVEIKKPEV